MMMVLLQAVIEHGTGSAAAALKHPLGGKTGTTNDFTDAWFVGFSPSITCGTWIGFDDRQTLGKGEQGAKAALPMWIDFMKAAIVGKDDEKFPTGDAPKKHLDVAVASGDQTAKPDEDADPDTDTLTDDGVKPLPTPSPTPSQDVPQTPAPIVRQPPAKVPEAPATNPPA